MQKTEATLLKKQIEETFNVPISSRTICCLLQQKNKHKQHQGPNYSLAGASIVVPLVPPKVPRFPLRILLAVSPFITDTAENSFCCWHFPGAKQQRGGRGIGLPKGKWKPCDFLASARKEKLGSGLGEEQGSGPQEAVCSLCSSQLEVGDVLCSTFCRERATTSCHSRKFCPSTAQCQVRFFPLPFTYTEKAPCCCREGAKGNIPVFWSLKVKFCSDCASQERKKTQDLELEHISVQTDTQMQPRIHQSSRLGSQFKAHLYSDSTHIRFAFCFKEPRSQGKLHPDQKVHSRFFFKCHFVCLKNIFGHQTKESYVAYSMFCLQ